MSCVQTFKGIDLSCKDSLGGIIEVYVADKSAVTGITGVTAEGTTGATYSGQPMSNITAIGVSGTTPFKPFKFRKQTGNMTSTINTDDANGTSFVQTDVVVQFTKMETAKRLEFSALIAGNCAVIVKDNNGKFWYLGLDNPVTLTAGSGATGQAMGDFNGYSATITDISKELPCEVLASAVESIITEIVTD